MQSSRLEQRVRILASAAASRSPHASSPVLPSHPSFITMDRKRKEPVDAAASTAACKVESGDTPDIEIARLKARNADLEQAYRKFDSKFTVAQNRSKEGGKS